MQPKKLTVLSQGALTVSLFLSLALTGCGDSKAATKENFRKSLTAFFGKSCAMLSANARFPLTMGGDGSGMPAQDVLLEADKIMAFKEAGLLTVTSKFMPLSSPGRPEKTEVLSYAPSEKGKPLYRDVEAIGPGSPPGFCAGHIEVISVDSFSEPVASNGQLVSQVNISAMTQYDDWTHTPSVQKAFAREVSHDKPAPFSLPMVLMNDGWAVSVAAR